LEYFLRLDSRPSKASAHAGMTGVDGTRQEHDL
jgi:hypothetical protein